MKKILYLALTAAMFASCCKEDTTPQGPVLYAVGDYYPDPDVTFSAPGVVLSGTAPVGIVFWLDNPVDGKSEHGKIVSLDEPPANWNGGTNPKSILAWGPSGETSAGSWQDGTLNMADVKAIDDDFSDYPAFKWCADKTTGGKTWYLPARNELKALYAGISGLRWVASGAVDGEVNDWKNYPDGEAMPGYATDAAKAARTNFNNKLKAATSGMEIDLSSYTWYWSSTETVNGGAWLVFFDDGHSLDVNKYLKYRVRAVSAF